MSTPLNAGTANLVVNSCVGALGPDGELVGSLPNNWQRDRHIFGTWYDETFEADAINRQSTPVEALRGVGDLIIGHAMAPTWWHINIWGREILRDGFPGPLSPLSRAELIQSAPKCTRAKARIWMDNIADARCIDVDIGSGIRLDVNTAICRVELLLPSSRAPFQGAFNLQDIGTLAQNTTLQLGNGAVMDALISGTIKPAFSPSPDNYATFTQRVRYGAGVAPAPVLNVPSAAKFVTIYPGGAVPPAPLPDPWAFVTSGPGIGVPDGALVFSATGPHPYALKMCPVPGTSCFLLPAATQNPPEIATVIWHLEI